MSQRLSGEKIPVDSHRAEPARPMQTRTQKPTVCQLVHGLNVGGAEILVSRIAHQLEDRFRFVFACLDHCGRLGDELRRDGFTVHVLERRPGLDWRCIWRLSRFLRSQQVDLVHAHQYTPFFQGLVSRCLSGGLPVLFTEHGRHHPDLPSRKRILFNRVMLGRADRVVGVGRAVRTALIDNEGLPPARVEVIHNGVNLAACLETSGARREEIRRELGLGAEEFVVICVARLDRLKDHPTAIRAAGQLVRHGVSTRLLLVGEGPERDALEQLARQNGLEGCVSFLGLRMDVPRLLAASDAFLLSSISEGIPLCLIEAMAAGLPVVATDVGGVGEVVEPGMTGFMSAAGDAAGLGQHLIRLASDASLRREMGLLGQQRAIAHFSEPAMLAHYDRLYREMAQ